MSTELPATSRHRRDMTERLLKATLSPKQTNKPFISLETFQQYFSCITARRQDGVDHNKNSAERGNAPVRTWVVYIVWFFLIAESIPGFLLNEPVHDKTNKMACAPSEDRSAWASAQSDQSLHCTQWVAQDPRLLRLVRCSNLYEGHCQ